MRNKYIEPADPDFTWSTAQHGVSTRIALYESFLAHGLRDVEQHALDYLLRHCAEQGDEHKEWRARAIFETVTPPVVDGVVFFAHSGTVGDTLDGDVLDPNQRVQLALLAYTTHDGTTLGPLKNPAHRFNEEYRDSCECGAAKLRPDTRMGRMSNRSFERERSRTIQASELWYGARYRYPSEIALAILSRYGTVCPDVMHLYTYDGDDMYIEDYLMPTAEKRGKTPTVEALDVLFETSFQNRG